MVKSVVFQNESGLIIRPFRKNDAKACEQIFQANLAKNYSDLTHEQRTAMQSVNNAQNFIEFAERKNDRLLVMEKNGKVVGYVHFAREGKDIRVKRFQTTHDLISWGITLTKVILPIIERYRINWGCKTIYGEMGSHLEKHIPALKRLGFEVMQKKEKEVGGRKIEFIPVKWKAAKKIKPK